MMIAVTGGSGNIGRRTCRELAQAGHEVLCLDIVEPMFDVPYRLVDLCAAEDTVRALRGVDVVVHLAAIPNPYNDPRERVMGVNTQSSLNVFEAARELGTRRVVYGCSESATGFGIHIPELKPLYVPIDEEHPCWPHETYSLSKYFGECMGRNYSRAYGLEVLSLRYTWVWFEDMRRKADMILREKDSAAMPDKPWFGAYISVGDVARAILAAVEYQAEKSPFFEAFLLTARDTFYGRSTLDVLEKIYGDDPPPVRDAEYFESNPHASVFDIRKAERYLNWTPQDHLEDVQSWEF